MSSHYWQLVADDPVEFEKWLVEVGDYRKYLGLEKNRQLVADDPVEFEKKLVEVGECRKYLGSERIGS